MVTFTVPGKPFGKQRPRSGQGRVFTPDQTVTAEAVIKIEAIPHFPVPFEGPVRVMILAVFAIPASWSKKRQAESLGRPHTSKPDKDNIEKAVVDALNGVAFGDDAQIAAGGSRKVWGRVAKTIIRVEQIDASEIWSMESI